MYSPAAVAYRLAHYAVGRPRQSCGQAGYTMTGRAGASTVNTVGIPRGGSIKTKDRSRAAANHVERKARRIRSYTDVA